MSHPSIYLDQVSFILSHKVCFENFTANIISGSRIAIVGRNGVGKSTLLHAIQGNTRIEGNLHSPKDIRFGYVPQMIETESTSGAERFHLALTQALAVNPNVLLLDEPTNHLDLKNRKALFRLIDKFEGTIVLASHDEELLSKMELFWHIDQRQITVYNESYEAFQLKRKMEYLQLLDEVDQLKQQRKALHVSLMKEQARAKQSREKGFKSINNRKWPTIVNKAKADRSAKTTGRKRASIDTKKQNCIENLNKLKQPEVIIPTFNLSTDRLSEKVIISVKNGEVGYPNKTIIKDIHLSIYGTSRVVIAGSNGCGKSTMLKAIIADPSIDKKGQWMSPTLEYCGYLDQHFQNLTNDKSVFETVYNVVDGWSERKIRDHLATFLFFKNEEVNMLTQYLSGGEKVRLSLALIAAKTPPLLILDEVTNNLDSETKNHVIQVLQRYPGALILVSHDPHFLNSINLTDCYEINGCMLIEKRLGNLAN